MNGLSITILKYLLCPTLLLELPSLSPRLMLFFPFTINVVQVDELLRYLSTRSCHGKWWKLIMKFLTLHRTGRARLECRRLLVSFPEREGMWTCWNLLQWQLEIFAKIVPGLFLSSEFCHAARESPLIHLPCTWHFYSKVNNFPLSK